MVTPHVSADPENCSSGAVGVVLGDREIGGTMILPGMIRMRAMERRRSMERSNPGDGPEGPAPSGKGEHGDDTDSHCRIPRFYFSWTFADGCQWFNGFTERVMLRNEADHKGAIDP